MILLPDPIWPAVLLAGVALGDAAFSIKPPALIRNCLISVGFPLEWGWALIVIKTLGAAGLIAGIWIPGLAFAANVAFIVYFVCAAIAHIRARALGSTFWVNCLGMLALTTATLVISHAHVLGGPS